MISAEIHFQVELGNDVNDQGVEYRSRVPMWVEKYSKTRTSRIPLNSYESVRPVRSVAFFKWNSTPKSDFLSRIFAQIG